MRSDLDQIGRSKLRARVALLLGAALLALSALALISAPAPAQDLESDLSNKQEELDDVRADKEVLTSEISAFNDDISQLEGEVAVLRNREAAVEAELAAKQAELEEAKAALEAEKNHLVRVRKHLKRSLVGLRERIVAIYEAGTPDIVSVILDSNGFDDLVARTEYLKRIQAQDESVVGRVRDLRNETKTSVLHLREVEEQIEAARNEIAAKERELERTRSAVEGRQAELEATRGERQAVLDSIETTEQHLEGDISDISAEISAQIAEATGTTPLPAGPIPDASSAGFIWPIDGVLTSPFGWRWGRMHEGIDIGASEGTPIMAAASGTVILAAYSGGYGNYTCIDHGGGLSTCYAHQSGYATSAGASVSQGEVIGYVGNTGSSYGAHLHFEVRIGGSAVDPLGYL